MSFNLAKTRTVRFQILLVSSDDETSLPGFRIERGGEPLMIEVGLLPGDKLFYRDKDEFLTMEELTRRILDRAFFPKLGE